MPDAKGIDLPQRDSWQEAWELAVDLTVAELRRADLAERCRKSGAALRDPAGPAALDFLGQTYLLQPPDFSVTRDGREVHITERILLLHYLRNATGKAPTGRWISFAEVPGGQLYMKNFQARSVDRLLRAFGGREQDLLPAAGSVGAQPADLAEISFSVQALPMVPVALAMWRGDDEFPASCNMLFDATVTDYLSIEDTVVLAGIVAGNICKALPKGG
jgi:hypothetical protein